MSKRARPKFLRTPFWQGYVDEYVNEPGYWYQPKGLMVSRQNLPLIKRRLSELRPFVGEKWGKVQLRYTKRLAKKRLVDLKSTSSAAIARMNKVVFHTLGLAWTDRDSTVLITDTGKQFLRAKRSDQEAIVRKQLLKYQLSNPSFAGDTGNIRLFPHLFLLEVLLQLPEDGIDRREYVLFVARARSAGDVDGVVEKITRFRELSKSQQKELVAHLKGFPVVRKGRLATGGRRTSIYNTVALNASYSLGFFAFPHYIELDHSGRIVVPRRHLGEAVRVARRAGEGAYYTEFDNEKDWFSYYGDPKRSGSVTDAMEYYESRSDIDRAVRAFMTARARGLASKTKPGEYVELRVKEKMLEDLLEFNLYLLEKGLSLVGRQYPTPTGPIDLLARDSKRQYVVIELKKGRAGDKAVGQLHRYRGYILQELARPGQRVRGMIVSQSIDKRLKYAVRALRSEPVQLFKFLFEADVREVKP